MPYAGGVYTLPPGTTATSGTPIDSSDYNAAMDDIEAAQNTARPIVAGGTGAVTAPLALTALGLSANGKALVTAADYAAMRALLDLEAGTDFYAKAAADAAFRAFVPRTPGTTASSSTPTPDADNNDQYNVTALAANATFGAPTGTPVDSQKLVIRIKDNATSRTLAWNAIYRAIGVTLPTATTISKTLYIGCIYNAAATKWDVLAVSQEA